MPFVETVLLIQVSSRRNCYNSFGSRIARGRPLTRSSKHSNELRHLLGVALLIRQRSYLPKQYPIAPRSKTVLFVSQRCLLYLIVYLSLSPSIYITILLHTLSSKYYLPHVILEINRFRKLSKC